MHAERRNLRFPWNHAFCLTSLYFQQSGFCRLLPTLLAVKYTWSDLSSGSGKSNDFVLEFDFLLAFSSKFLVRNSFYRQREKTIRTHLNHYYLLDFV